MCHISWHALIGVAGAAMTPTVTGLTVQKQESYSIKTSVIPYDLCVNIHVVLISLMGTE